MRHDTQKAPSHLARRGSRGVGRTLAASFCALAVFVLLAACAPAGSTPPAARVGEASCMRAGDHCEYSDQCCSGRCYHETGCAGGTP
jgi:hypothetical protein